MNSPFGPSPAQHRATPEPAAFDVALAGIGTHLQLDDGSLLRLTSHRWHSKARGSDHWILNRCHGPTIDLGCGPGRLVAGLLSRGVRALGVDASEQANAGATARGVPVLLGNVFHTVPHEGRWHHAILADGNIGIGGNPAALLRRTAHLLAPGGRVLVEVQPRNPDMWRGQARVSGDTVHGPWFQWAILGVDALRSAARAAGMTVTSEYHTRRRCFVELVTSPGE